MSGIQRLALVAAIGTYLLIVLGAAVRVTGSGLGCPDWPLCHGQLVPPLEAAALIEYTHRLVAALDSGLIVAVVVGVWLFRRREPALLWPAGLVLLLVVGQIALGAVAVVQELPASIVGVHLAFAMLILGLLVWMTVAVGPASVVMTAGGAEGSASPLSRRFLRLAGVATAAVFLLVLTGAYVRATGASWACVGFPGCNGHIAPFGLSPLVDTHLLHRFVAYGVAALLGYVVLQVWRMPSRTPALASAAGAVVVSVLFQLIIGAAAVSTELPALLRGLHVAGAAALWASVVALASVAVHNRQGLGETTVAAIPGPQQTSTPVGLRALAVAYLKLTKPGIISLLLVTTLASMMVAAEGMPPLALVLMTLLGGALSAGGANAFNCYLDRDIDGLMSRTNERPLPAGVLQPHHALGFGFLLTVLSVLILGVFVNWLASTLALGGLLYYVFVYTCWLKRSTPNNIVIGGAAGAVPPLVGWAAVTGEVSLLAVYLFAIIFFWTPPHFWALALVIRREYERARIPMLPIVRGDAETRQQILIYSLWLVAFTLLVVVFRQAGVFYLTAAMVLGGFFVYHAVRLFREATAAAARNLFRYSILYLALLFAAMVIDRWKTV